MTDLIIAAATANSYIVEVLLALYSCNKNRECEKGITFINRTIFWQPVLAVLKRMIHPVVNVFPCCDTIYDL